MNKPFISYDDYRWYKQAIEKLWHVDIFSDAQHDRAVKKLEKMYESNKKVMK